MPQFRIKVKNFRAEWWEEYSKEEVTDLSTAKKWAEETLQFFNTSERAMYGDKGQPRTLEAVEMLA